MTDLRKIRYAAAKVAAARKTLAAEIREERARGTSLRKISEAAKVSHEQVRRISR